MEITSKKEFIENKEMTVPSKPKSTNFIFKYNTVQKKVSGYKIAYSNLDEIRALDIANLEKEKDVKSVLLNF